MKTIFLYSDEGVCPFSMRATARSLKNETDYPVRLVKRDFFLQNGWEKQAAWVVFPGGRDVYYLRALQGEANRRIRSYVHNGGQYFGICAGAYYASASICFEPGGPLEVVGPRELAFFPGCASGPALGLGQFSYIGTQGARIVALTLNPRHFTEPSIDAYYHGGCAFMQAAAYPGIDVLAYYKDLNETDPAIILCQAGQGKALLSGIHPEYLPSEFDANSPKPLKIDRTLSNGFFKQLIRH